jgi:hypothetical protein
MQSCVTKGNVGRSVRRGSRDLEPLKPIEDIMADDYVELFLKWTPDANADVVRHWLEQRGLTVMAMKSGLLLSGTKSQVEKAFSVSLKSIELPQNLPVPAELHDHAASITLPRPRSYNP